MNQSDFLEDKLQTADANSDLGRLKRKYHKIRTENSQSQNFKEPVQVAAGSSQTLHAGSWTPISSGSSSLHGGTSTIGEVNASSKFCGKLVDTLFIIEVCAGTARLSRTAQNMGFKVMAIDHSSKRSCGMPIQCFELEDPAQVQSLSDFIATEHCNIAYVFMAPSCGTASRARERKHAKLEKLGHALPQPLRSESQRCLDLKHAYKQLVRHPSDNWVSVIASVNPEDSQVYFFEAIALPFGSVSSVIAFNRVARALRMILSKLFKLVVTNFFDDFCQLELDTLSNSAHKTAELVLELLGWEISKGDDKRKPFSSSFEILGAVVSFEFDKTPLVKISNKTSRIEQLVDAVGNLKKQVGQKVSRAIIESLKGRLLYAAGHTHGRCTQLACQLLHRFAGDGSMVMLSVELVHAVVMALEQLVTSKPREIMPWSQQQSVLIFTDGAVEDDFGSVTYGALLVDMCNGKRFFFGGHVPDSLVEDWRSNGKKQVISQAEIFPILVSKETWATYIYQRSVLWFADNESARMALIRNYSPVIDNFLLLQVNSQLDLRVEARHWYSRVPSKSNPSDAASRLSFESYSNASWSEPCFKLCLDSLLQLSELKKLLERGGV